MECGATTFSLQAEYLNPLISAGYRALAQGAEMQILWNDAQGYPVDPYPGQKAFNITWRTFQRYDINFNVYVEHFNDHFRKYTKRA